MLTMSQINDIRDLSQKGYSISKISSLTGLDRKTVRKYLNQDDFSPQPPVAKRRTSIVTPYLDIIEEWLEEDQKHWSKQRHTAKRIHERLQTEYGFTGSYDSVQKFGGCGRFLVVTMVTGTVAQNVSLLARYVSPVKKSESSRKE